MGGLSAVSRICWLHSPVCEFLGRTRESWVLNTGSANTATCLGAGRGLFCACSISSTEAEGSSTISWFSISGSYRAPAWVRFAGLGQGAGKAAKGTYCKAPSVTRASRCAFSSASPIGASSIRLKAKAASGFRRLSRAVDLEARHRNNKRTDRALSGWLKTLKTPKDFPILTTMIIYKKVSDLFG